MFNVLRCAVGCGHVYFNFNFRLNNPTMQCKEQRGNTTKPHNNVDNLKAEKGGVAGGVRCEDDVYKDCQRRVGAGACTGPDWSTLLPTFMTYWAGSGASNLNLTERLDQSDWSGEAGTDDPHHEARLALAECRQSCQALINTKYSQSELPSIVQLYGGIQVIRQHNSILDQLQVEFCHRRFRIQISSL